MPRFQVWFNARIPASVGRDGNELWEDMLWGTYDTRGEAEAIVAAQGENGENNPKNVRRAWVVEVT